MLFCCRCPSKLHNKMATSPSSLSLLVRDWTQFKSVAFFPYYCSMAASLEKFLDMNLTQMLAP
jgi:hypothetical protein